MRVSFICLLQRSSFMQHSFDQSGVITDSLFRSSLISSLIRVSKLLSIRLFPFFWKSFSSNEESFNFLDVVWFFSIMGGWTAERDSLFRNYSNLVMELSQICMKLLDWVSMISDSMVFSPSSLTSMSILPSSCGQIAVFSLILLFCETASSKARLPASASASCRSLTSNSSRHDNQRFMLIRYPLQKVSSSLYFFSCAITSRNRLSEHCMFNAPVNSSMIFLASTGRSLWKYSQVMERTSSIVGCI